MLVNHESLMAVSTSIKFQLNHGTNPFLFLLAAVGSVHALEGRLYRLLSSFLTSALLARILLELDKICFRKPVTEFVRFFLNVIEDIEALLGRVMFSTQSEQMRKN